MQRTRSVSRLFAVVAALVCFAVAAPADTLRLKDGRVLEGKVLREADEFVYFAAMVGGIENPQLFSRADIESLEREGDATPGRTGAPNESERGEKPRSAVSSGATRIAFISLEEMVGPFMNADALSHSVELLEDDDVDIIVLRVNSGGGALLEVKPLSDVIQEEIKPKYRVVGWIESAISAACMTIWTCEELYMMPNGNMGAAVAFSQGSGGAKAIEGENLERVLRLGELLSRRGNRDPNLLRSMQEFMTLSCDIDEHGRVTWHDDASGEYLVSSEDRILTLNSVDAIKYGAAQGVASTKDELARVLGCSEWVEVGPEADRYQQEFRENVGTAQVKLTELNQKYQIAIKYRQIGRAQQFLSEMRTWVRKAPSLETYSGLTDEWFRQQEEELRKLRQEERDSRRR